MKMDLARMHLDVLRGLAGGQVIWQPRIGCWHTDKVFAGQPLPEPYTGLTLFELYRALGCSARLYEFTDCFRRVEDARVLHQLHDVGDGRVEHIIDTPVGRQLEVLQSYPSSPFPRHVKWEVSTVEELRVAAWREEHAQWAWDQAVYEHHLAEMGDLGAPTMFMPRMNVQSLYLEKMGVEQGVMALFEWTDAVEAFFDALEQSHEQLIEVINACPIEVINFGENVHSGTLSPELFKRYHLPACQRRCERLHAAGKFVLSHWDGNCRPLLPYAKDTGLDGIEAITPWPQGDVTLEEIKDALGDELFLLDGIPAVYFDDTYSVETLDACVERLLELFAPKLVLGISDELSSTGEIERVLRVNEMIDKYNGSLKCNGLAGAPRTSGVS